MKSEIPNIIGTQNSWTHIHDESSGALYVTWRGNEYTLVAGTGVKAIGTGLNASLSSDRYGDYTEVNPLYTSYLPIIKY